MNGFGGLGGLGGRASFPMRYGAPNSQPVEGPLLGLGTFDEWDTDWKKRLAGTPQQITTTNWQDITDLSGKALPDGSAVGQLTPFINAMGSADKTRWSGDRYMAGYNETSANPEYAQMLAEREQMMPHWENQTRNQQSYDSMMGGHQPNAVIGENYSDANFGSVTGQPGGTTMPEVDGVNMDWASGIYDPNYASGMFGNTGRRKQGWL